jgi:uncharacterized membrane protein YkoI
MSFKLLLATLLITVAQISLAGHKLPEDALPLSEIIAQLENQGYHKIIEVEIERGVWEVEAYKDDQKREIKVDPLTGKIISDEADD